VLVAWKDVKYECDSLGTRIFKGNIDTAFKVLVKRRQMKSRKGEVFIQLCICVSLASRKPIIGKGVEEKACPWQRRRRESLMLGRERIWSYLHCHGPTSVSDTYLLRSFSANG